MLKEVLIENFENFEFCQLETRAALLEAALGSELTRPDSTQTNLEFRVSDAQNTSRALEKSVRSRRVGKIRELKTSRVKA